MSEEGKITGRTILKTSLWIIGVLWVSMFLIAVVYKDDPVVRTCVRSVSVSIASFLSDSKELKDAVKADVKKELQEHK